MSEPNGGIVVALKENAFALCSGVTGRAGKSGMFVVMSDSAPVSTTTPLPDVARVLHEAQYIRDEIKHEYTLLSGRVNAYLSSQAFLVSAYAISMGNANPHFGKFFTLAFPLLLCLLGLVLSWLAKEGIDGALETIELWRSVLDQKARNDTEGALYQFVLLAPTPQDTPAQSQTRVADIHRQSTYFSRAVAPVFLIAWVAFFALALVLHFL